MNFVYSKKYKEKLSLLEVRLNHEIMLLNEIENDNYFGAELKENQEFKFVNGIWFFF